MYIVGVVAFCKCKQHTSSSQQQRQPNPISFSSKQGYSIAKHTGKLITITSTHSTNTVIDKICLKIRNYTGSI